MTVPNRTPQDASSAAPSQLLFAAGVPIPAPARGALILDVEEANYFWCGARRAFLRRAGFAYEEVDGGAGAQSRRLAEPCPALVIVCRTQPGAAGAIREAERQTGLPRVPIIIAGGLPADELLAIARDCDADAFCRMDRPRWAELVETVLRTGWPSLYMDAYRERYGTAPGPWPAECGPAAG